LEQDHIPSAAALVVEGYGRERRAVPILTGHPESRDEIESLLRGRLARAPAVPGVAAFYGSQLVGFLIGVTSPNLWSSHKGVFAAEWSHGAAGEHRGQVYREMYGALSEKWVEAGILTHSITLFAHDQEALNAWFRSEFGLRVIDAIRDLAPLDAPIPPGVQIRRATVDDLYEVFKLRASQAEYMSRAPLFMPTLEPEPMEETAAFLENSANALFIAIRDGAPVAYIRYQEEPEDGAARAVQDPGTAAINGAYTVEGLRRGGIASALLSQLIAQAKLSGYQRISVDFESFNILGSGFWLRHFTPVCFGLNRKVDDRILL